MSVHQLGVWGPRARVSWVGCIALVTASSMASEAFAGGSEPDHGTTFSDASGDLHSYARSRSHDFDGVAAIRTGSLTTPWAGAEMPLTPMGSHGLSGTSVFDFDGDGDLDIFVTNGPGAPNALFENQMSQTGTMSFVDVAGSAGVTGIEMDANGSCHGDIDNDGDSDLLVLGRAAPNRLYENLGDGTFEEVVDSGLDLDLRSHPACTMGDVDGDGRLDIAVANAFQLGQLFAIFVEPFAFNEHNQLYLNRGDNTFSDVSAQSGIEQLQYLPPGAASITWALAFVDVDLDGDVDLVHADDQGGIPTTGVAGPMGVDRGFVHVLLNDGEGNFTDQPGDFYSQTPGSWMGVGFGDFDCDGAMDVFGSNFGDYHMPTLGLPYSLGDQATRIFYGAGDGTLIDPGWVAEGTAFGWGNAVFDIDNDGDSDAVYYGGLEMLPIGLRDNPGVVVENHGCGATLETNVTSLGARHQRRNVRSTSIGDLDRDGFVDIVTASNWDVPEPVPTLPGPASYGSTLDQFATFVPTFAPTDETGDYLVWTGIDYAPGTVAIDHNDGNENGGITIGLMGTVDTLCWSNSNREGIGAVVSATNDDGDAQMMPITGGSSHSSSHATEAYFGVGQHSSVTVDVLWPGRTRNRLYDVEPGEHLVLPEIPCSYDTDVDLDTYMQCVTYSLNVLRDEGVTTGDWRVRLWMSAMRAYLDEH